MDSLGGAFEFQFEELSERVDLGGGHVGFMNPPALTNLQIELMAYHPDCMQALRDTMKGENYTVDVFYGVIAAYCGIVLEGTYNLGYLTEELTKALMRKRNPLVVVSAEETKNILNLPAEVLGQKNH